MHGRRRSLQDLLADRNGGYLRNQTYLDLLHNMPGRCEKRPYCGLWMGGGLETVSRVSRGRDSSHEDEVVGMRMRGNMLGKSGGVL